MDKVERLKEWRASEILKIFLLKLNLGLVVEEAKSGLFDFVVFLKNRPEARFGIEVKSKSRFTSKLNKQITKLVDARDKRIFTFPILIVKIDDEIEKGELDFIVFPSFKENKLLVRETFKFSPLTTSNFENKVKTIIKWFDYIDINHDKEYLDEVELRTITDAWLENNAKEYLRNGFFGKTATAYLEVTNIIPDKSKKQSIENLIPLVKIKAYIDHAISNSKTIRMSDYNTRVVIEEINYPYVQASLNSFAISKPIEEGSSQKSLASVLSTIITSLEIMTVAFDNNYLVKGEIFLDNTYINTIRPDILSQNLMNSKKIIETSSRYTGIYISSDLASYIRSNIIQLNTSLTDYFNRFLYIDGDNLVVVNPAIALANHLDRKNKTLKSLRAMIQNTTDANLLLELNILERQLTSYSPNLNEDRIF